MEEVPSMKQSLTIVLLASLLTVFNHTHSKSLKGYWRRVTATDKQKQASLDILKKHENTKKTKHKEKQDYLTALSVAKEKDKAVLLHNKKILRRETLKNSTEPYSFITKFDSRYYHGANLELLNGSSGCDYYSFMQYLFDVGIYIHPHLHNLEKETLEFKAIARMKGIAGDAGRYLHSKPKHTKIGWATSEFKTETSTDRFSLWMRELWLKYYFNEDKKSFLVTGLFPFSVGHGIALGNGDPTRLGQPLPGQYTFNQIDQFRPGVLFSSTFSNDEALWDLYFGFEKNYNTSFNRTAVLSEAQNTDQSSNVSRGIDKHNYILAAQIKALLPTRNENTQFLVNPYFIFNYDNTQRVEFKTDAESRLYTLGSCFEWESGPLSVSVEGAQNLGHQQVKAWDRNQLNFSAITWNSHLLFIDPNLVATATYPNTLADAVTNTATQEDLYTHAIGIPASPTAQSVETPGAVPNAAYSRQFANGEIFEIYPATGLTPSPLIYKNSHSRFRKAYKNRYRGWFIMGDVGYQLKEWRFGGSLGIISGDDSPNDSTNYILATRRFANDSSGNAFTYKDINKTYKGFVGLHELFKTKSITPFFIHQAQKLNCPLTKCSGLTDPQLTNLLFLGVGLKHHGITHSKEHMADFNFIFYAQKKETSKGTNMPYTEFIDLEYSAARQLDAAKSLDTYLGFECNASFHYKLTHDLDISSQIALFVPGKYYTTAAGKYLSFDKQANLVVTNNSGIFTVPEQFNITLGNDTAFLATVGLTYSFDSLFLRNKQKAFDTQKLERK